MVVVLNGIAVGSDGEGGLRLSVGNGHRGRQYQQIIVGGQTDGNSPFRRIAADGHRSAAAALLQGGYRRLHLQRQVSIVVGDGQHSLTRRLTARR